MTNEEKQALIKFCNTVVSDIKSDAVAHEDEIIMSTLQVFEIALATLTAQQDDTKRMDWLVSKTVEVRQPLRYGSRHIFWSEAVTDEEDDHHATLLREQIDAAIASEV